MPNPNIQSIPLVSLLVDLANPRHSEQLNQREAISTIAFDQGVKLANLAEDIAERGLNPGDLPLVTPASEDGFYIVLEGNRRLAALKLMTSPALLSSIGLPKNLNARFRNLHRDYASVLPSEVTCSVLSRDDARHWILQKHTGENEGKGIVMWDGRARQRFRGTSPASQVIDLVEQSDLIDQATRGKLEKVAITNIERVLSTPDARSELGVDIRKGELVFTESEQVALGRLALVVTDIANKDKKVTDLDSKEQRIAYAKEVAARPLPTPIAEGGSIAPASQATSSGTKGGSKGIKPDRAKLIPRKFKISIGNSRINRIYHELRNLNVDQFVNCAAVMLRVFVELSVDQYGQTHGITLTTSKGKPGTPPQNREMSLGNKLRTVAQYMEDNQLLTKDELRGIRTLAEGGFRSLSVDSLNAYVHNKDFNPSSSDLKAVWDSIERFIERLW